MMSPNNVVTWAVLLVIISCIIFRNPTGLHDTARDCCCAPLYRLRLLLLGCQTTHGPARCDLVKKKEKRAVEKKKRKEGRKEIGSCRSVA